MYRVMLVILSIVDNSSPKPSGEGNNLPTYTNWKHHKSPKINISAQKPRASVTNSMPIHDVTCIMASHFIAMHY